MTAREALQKARATMECWDADCAPPWDSCEMDRLWELWDEHHPQGASVLLDGFTVAEVTRAERDLAREDQP